MPSFKDLQKMRRTFVRDYAPQMSNYMMGNSPLAVAAGYFIGAFISPTLPVIAATCTLCVVAIAARKAHKIHQKLAADTSTSRLMVTNDQNGFSIFKLMGPAHKTRMIVRTRDMLARVTPHHAPGVAGKILQPYIEDAADAAKDVTVRTHFEPQTRLVDKLALCQNFNTPHGLQVQSSVTLKTKPVARI